MADARHGPPRPRRAPADGGLRHLFRANLRQVHFSSIETGGVSPGIPDLEGCWDGSQFWVELKAAERNAVVIRPMQVAWLMRRARAGGRCFIAVRVRRAASRGRPVTDALAVYRGADAARLRADGLCAAVPLGQWVGGPQAWAWGEVLAVLAVLAEHGLEERVGQAAEAPGREAD